VISDDYCFDPMGYKKLNARVVVSSGLLVVQHSMEWQFMQHVEKVYVILAELICVEQDAYRSAVRASGIRLRTSQR